MRTRSTFLLPWKTNFKWASLRDLTFRENGVDCVNLAEILRALWELGILLQADVRDVITEIRTKDNLKFRTTDSIFK